MKHFLIFMSFLILTPKIGFSQEEQKPQYTNYIFDPKSNAKDDMLSALNIANKENKYLLILVGGDWDYWSRNINEVLISDTSINNYMTKYFVYLRINFSPINKNEEILNSLQCPKSEGYPIFIVLDKTGKKLYTQNADDFKKKTKSISYNIYSLLSKWIHKTNIETIVK